MRWRESTHVGAFEGQLLFADMQDGVLTLDCVLTREGSETGAPVTLSVRFPRRTRTRELAIELLEQWADEGATIEVTISDRHARAQVEIASASGRVVLEPEALPAR